jgi:hypothetical protein
VTDDPVRWKDTDDAPGAVVRELLRSGAEVPPMPSEVRAALLAALPSPSPSPTANGASGEVMRSGSSLVRAAAWVAGAAGTGAIVAALAWPSTSTPETPAPTLSATSTASSSSVLPSPSFTAPPASAEMPPVVAPPRPTTGERVKPAVPAPSADTLAEESALIGRARSTLGSNPAASLSVVEEHARRHPSGELAPEREYLRLSALRRLGRIDEARTNARSYLVRYPSSPYVPTVKTMLGELESP